MFKDPAAEEAPSVGPQPHLDDAPILADFLAMGAGRMAPKSSTGPAASPLRPPRPSSADLFNNIKKSHEALPTPAVRERRLVEAALQKSEVLEKVLLETPPRAPLEIPRRPPKTVPEIFREAQHSYTSQQERDSDAEIDSGANASLETDEGWQRVSGEGFSSSSSSPRNLRLRVRPWHRLAMQRLLCRALLFQFMQDLREARGLRAEEPPLCLFEFTFATQQSEKGLVVELVKYLAETQLHIAHGPVRRQQAPGKRISAEEIQRLRAERRELVKKRGLKRQPLEENDVLRIFMDGALSWSRIRSLLLGSQSTSAFQSSPASAVSTGSASAGRDSSTASVPLSQAR